MKNPYEEILETTRTSDAKYNRDCVLRLNMDEHPNGTKLGVISNNVLMGAECIPARLNCTNNVMFNSYAILEVSTDNGPDKIHTLDMTTGCYSTYDFDMTSKLHRCILYSTNAYGNVPLFISASDNLTRYAIHPFVDSKLNPCTLYINGGDDCIILDVEGIKEYLKQKEDNDRDDNPIPVINIISAMLEMDHLLSSIKTSVLDNILQNGSKSNIKHWDRELNSIRKYLESTKDKIAK